MKIRKGDRVKVIAGRSKGKVGDVLRVLPAESRVVVSGVNVIKRHTKPGRTEAGGIIEDLDFDWGATCRPLAASPATELRQVLPFRRSGSPRE